MLISYSIDCLLVVVVAIEAAVTYKVLHEYQTAVVGQKVTLSCRSRSGANEPSVIWWYQPDPPTSADHDDIYVVNGLVNGFKTTCVVNRPTNDTFNLVILNVTLNNTGIYTCIEDGGFGNRHLIHLNVSIDVSKQNEQGYGNPSVSMFTTTSLDSDTTGNVATHDNDSTDWTPYIVAGSVVGFLIVIGIALGIVFWRLSRNGCCGSQSHEEMLERLKLLDFTDGREFWSKIVELLKSKKARKKKRDATVRHCDERVRDIFTLTGQPEQYKECLNLMVDCIRDLDDPVDAIVGLDSRGFVFGPPVAQQLDLPFIPVRKEGKLIGPTKSEGYTTRKGESCTLEVQECAFAAIRNLRGVVIVDDELATGGSLKATLSLMNQLGAPVSRCVVLLELLEYSDRQVLGPTDRKKVESLIKIEPRSDTAAEPEQPSP